MKKRLSELGLSQGDVAKAIGLERANLTRMLAGRSGALPKNWQILLDYLGLEVIVRKKK